MAKVSMKDILLQKGDKIALIAGGTLGGLLLIWGVVTAVSAQSPSTTVKEFENQTRRVTSGVQGEGEPAPPLPDWVVKVTDAKEIPSKEFDFAGRPFEPVHQPSLLAENPRVLGITAWQFDMLRVPMVSLDLDTSGAEPRIGVLVQRSPSDKDKAKTKRDIDEALRKLDPRYRPQSKGSDRGGPNRPGGGFPGGGFPGGGGMPGMPGGGGMPGMPGGGGMPGMPGGGGMPGMPGEGMPGGGMPGMPGGFGGMGMEGLRDDKAVDYKTPDELARGNYQLAQTVYPLRAVMVHGVFPLRAQLEEMQRALKIPPKRDAQGRNTFAGVPIPVFDGFEVERRVLRYGGDKENEKDWSQWATFNHYDVYYTQIRARAWGYQSESPELLRYLRPSEKLTAPLPLLADQLGSYDSIRIPVIQQEIAKMREMGQQPLPESEWQKRFKGSAGEDNPYVPQGGYSGYGNQGMMGSFGGDTGSSDGDTGGGPGMPGMPGGGRGGPGMPGMPSGGRGGPAMPGMPSMPGSGGPTMPGMPGGPTMPGMPGGPTMPGMPGGGGFGGYGSTYNQGPDVENLLIRFFDPTVLPGASYQYRIKMKMKNPNFGSKNVGRPADAKLEVLEGPWVRIPEVVTPPAESFMYAYNTNNYLDEFKDFYDRYNREYVLRQLFEQDAVQAGRRAIVQIQTWMEKVRIDGAGNRVEPVGTWVVAEMPVAPGEYIGKRMLVELPLWSAGLGNYMLRELTGGVKVANVRNPQNQPKGWPINFRSLTGQLLLADFDGGRVTNRINGVQIVDDSATELLILRPDGKVMVRNSAVDETDKNRQARANTWDDWLKRVKDRKMMTAPSGPAGGGFGRPGDTGSGDGGN